MQNSTEPGVSVGLARGQGEPQTILRFVEGKPSTNQTKQETRALIRAHASRYSWARLERPSYKARIKSSKHPPRRRNPPEPHVTPSKNRPIPGFVEGHYQEEDCAQEDDLSTWRGVQLQLPEETILGPQRGVANPLTSVGIGDIDPFESYPSDLPRDVVNPLLDQG